MEVRFWNTHSKHLKFLTNVESVSKSRGVNRNVKEDTFERSLYNDLIAIDQKELKVLRAQQLVEFESTKIPLIGVSIPSRDVSLVGSLALLIIYIWYFLSIVKERSVLAQLLFPLVANSESKKAQLLWGVKNDENQVDKIKTDAKILIYKEEILDIRETISSRFLTLYANSKKRLLEYMTTAFLTFMPVILLAVSVSFDMYWDYLKEYKESKTNFITEISGYEKSLRDAASKVDKGSFEDKDDLSEMLVLSADEMNTYVTVIHVKRWLALAIVLILFAICAYDHVNARTMTRILTNMHSYPDRLQLEEYVDV